MCLCPHPRLGEKAYKNTASKIGRQAESSRKPRFSEMDVTFKILFPSFLKISNRLSIGIIQKPFAISYEKRTASG